MRKLMVCLLVGILSVPAWAIVAGFNVDIHMDVPTDLPANDFHIEGRVESGSEPQLLWVISDFPEHKFEMAPDPDDPSGQWYRFRIDFYGRDFQYCEWLHLGLFFDLECHNLVIDLVGWWTRDVERLPARLPDGGPGAPNRVLIPGFVVQDLEVPQTFQVRNDSEPTPQPGQDPPRIVEFLLAKFTPDQVEQMGGMERLAQALRRGGGQEQFPWVPVVNEKGPIRPDNALDFPAESFFDVYIEGVFDPGGWGLWTSEPMPIAPSEVLISRIGVESFNNAGEPEFRWVWHMHEGHPPQDEFHELGDAPDSTNTHGARMTAYPPGIVLPPWGVQANFPTVYQAGSPPHGPIHWQPWPIHLGPTVTGEIEADIGPDVDGVNNIIPPQDQPDLDLGDDGVIFPLNLAWCQQNQFQYTVTVNNPVMRSMFVNVWFDWNMDGDWDDTVQCPLAAAPIPEWAVQNQQVQIPGPGVYTLTTPAFWALWPLGPIDWPTDHIWMRITLSEQQWAPPMPPVPLGYGGSGPAAGYQFGETEDYVIPAPPGPAMDFGDAPEDPTGAPPSYPTTLANNGAAHLVPPVFTPPRMGALIDTEKDGQPSIGADGDDLAGIDDEDGVIFTTPLVPGGVATVDIDLTFGGPNPIINAWLDFNADGDWDDLWWDGDEHIIADLSLASGGVHSVSFPVPAAAVAGAQTYARFRLSSQPGLGYRGLAPDGEVEDYLVVIESPPDRDWGDAPDGVAAAGYPTLRINNGASHLIDYSIHLGASIDPEPDGQPTPNADGDDNDGNDDEDGVVFNTWPLVPGRPAKITVTASVGGSLFAWVDFDADGSWAEPGDQIFNGQPLSAGPNVLVFHVPMTAKPNCTTFARFRFVRAAIANLGYTGDAPDGEVEDYIVKIGKNCGIKWLQRPDLSRAGIDIRVDGLRTIADDFLCTETAHITDVHLWGSKWKDAPEGEPPVIKVVHLSIHSDDPVGPGGSDPENRYSKPDELLWRGEFGPDDFTLKYVATVDGGEWWWDVREKDPIPAGDTEVWRVDIQIPRDRAFLQEGSEDKPIVYWLDVRVETEEGFTFGWKTRRWPEHFNDDAVIFLGSELPPFWQELRYPPPHPYHDLEKNSIDMAFAITSRAFCCRSADLNCDGVVDIEDFAIFAAQWLEQVP